MEAGPHSTKTSCRPWENLTRAGAWVSELAVAGTPKVGAEDEARVIPRLGQGSLFAHGFKRVTRSAQCFSRNVPILEEVRSFGNHMHLFQFRDKDRVRTSSKFNVFSTQWPEELSSVKPPCGFPSHPHPYSSCKAQGVLAPLLLGQHPLWFPHFGQAGLPPFPQLARPGGFMLAVPSAWVCFSQMSPWL